MSQELFIKENEWIWVQSESDNDSIVGNGSVTYTSAPTTIDSMCTAMNIGTDDRTTDTIKDVSILVQVRDCDDTASAMCVQG